MLSLKIKEDTEKRTIRDQCLDYLRGHTVEVGLTSKASARSKLLLAIHTHGSPIMRIPPRPVVEPALAQVSVKTEMASAMIKACEAAQQGDMAGTIAAMEQSGQKGADGIRAYIDKGVPPPNAPITISGGWLRNRVTGKPVHVKGKSGTKPLIDTGQLYNDFDYEIKER